MTYSRNSSGSVAATPVGDSSINNTGSQLNKGTPVSINYISGELDLVDVSNEASSKAAFAIVRENSADGESVEYITNGRVEDIDLSFNYGDVIYISKLGGLTNIAPTVGVGGFLSLDFLIIVGIIAKSLKDPTKKDLLVSFEPPHQLE
jgi:hypothetical protein